MMKTSLLTKVIVALVLVALVPLAWVTFSLIQINREAFTEQVLRLHAVNASATSSRVDAFLQVRRQLVKAAADHPALAEPQSTDSQEQLKGILSVDDSIKVIAVGIYAPDGTEVLRAQMPGAQEDAIDVLRNAPPNLNIATSNGISYLTVVEEIQRAHGEIRAVFQADALGLYLEPKELGQEAHLALLDASKHTLLQSTGAGSIPADLAAKAVSGQVSGAGHYEGQHGAKLLGAFAPIDLASWTIVSWQPIKVAEAVAYTMRRHSLGAAGLALLLVALLTLAAFRSVIRPLRMLILEHSDLLDGEQTKRGDEIGDLRKAFAALRQHAKDKRQIENVALGRYQVIKQIGAGAMGTVFQGWDPKLKRSVALKTIKIDDDRDGATHKHTSQLVREAVSAASVRHDNVVGVFDVEDTPDYSFVAMEFIDGDTLEGYLRKQGPLSESDTIQIGLAVARGLQAAHDKKIVHRDIKPANVLLGHEGEIKISDFGISALMTSLHADRDQVFGTPGYLPPETLTGQGFSEQGDLFALGVLLYECITGRLPFTGKSVRDVMLETVRNLPEPPQKLSPRLSDQLNNIILSLIEKDPDLRGDAVGLVELLSALKPSTLWTYRSIELEELNESALLPTVASYSSQLVETVNIRRAGDSEN